MKIVLNINKILKDSANEGRTNFFVWKNLGELKRHYSTVVDEAVIDDIAEEIQHNGNFSLSKRFSTRKDSTARINEQGLCNLVEIELLKRKEALDTFMKKPLYGCIETQGKSKKTG